MIDASFINTPEEAKTPVCIPVGPVDQSTKCVERAYSYDRIVPEFTQE